MSKNKLKDSLKKLKTIVEWLDTQEELDVEAGLEKVKEGAILIKESKNELKKLENEFEEVKKELKEVDGEEISENEKDTEPEESPY